MKSDIIYFIVYNAKNSFLHYLYFLSIDLEDGIREKEVCIGIVTQIDLLTHITKQQTLDPTSPTEPPQPPPPTKEEERQLNGEVEKDLDEAAEENVNVPE